jgi:prevent-host-death family protein
MSVTTFTSREFNQSASEAKRAANSGLVFITDRGSPAHVLMSIEHYRRLTASHHKIADLLAMPDGIEIDFEVPSARELARAADLA